MTGRAGAGEGGYSGVRGDDGDHEEQEEVDKNVMGDLKTLWGGEVCGLNPRIRVYRYGKGQFFGQHCGCTIDSLCYSRSYHTVFKLIFHPKSSCIYPH